MKRFLLFAAFFFPKLACAQTYHPDFSCQNLPPKNGVAVMLCQNSEAAKHELQFEQTYYALRQIVGKPGWKALKQEVILDENATNQTCGLPIPGDDNQLVPPDGANCYIAGMDRLTAKYKARLSGSALEEANRAIDQHIALQQKLIDLGYMPDGSVADGVYGESTRAAIQTWQRVNHRPSDDGFISDADAATLSGLISTPQAAVPVYQNTQPAIPAPPSSPSQSEIGVSQYDPCGGNIIPIPPASYYNGNIDPYGAEGKCFAISTAQPAGNIQWLTANALLILGYPVLIVSDQHIQLNQTVIGIAIKPIQYNSAMGSMNTPLTLRFLRYSGSF